MNPNLDELRALLERATPVEARDLMSYEHGGGRLAVLRDGQRKLVADFYGAGEDRDFFMALRLAAADLLTLAEAGMGAGWRPIEEAPRDGTRVMAWTREYDVPVVVQISEDGSAFEGDWDYEVRATHFMPLPAPPQERGDG